VGDSPDDNFTGNEFLKWLAGSSLLVGGNGFRTQEEGNMPPKRDDDDRERLSWREIDQRRDGARRREKAAPRMPKKQEEMVRKQALAQAEALFKGKRGQPEYQQALKKLEASHGTKKFAATAEKFLADYGLPEEWGALTRFLDYPDPATVVAVLQAMAEKVQLRSRVEKQGFKGRLQVLALTSPYEEVRQQAQKILETL
jgi:hypothetical protein